MKKEIKINSDAYDGTILKILDCGMNVEVGEEFDACKSMWEEAEPHMQKVFDVCKTRDDYITAEESINAVATIIMDRSFVLGFRKAMKLVLDSVSGGVPA